MFLSQEIRGKVQENIKIQQGDLSVSLKNFYHHYIGMQTEGKPPL
jgi:hypothetical protein